MDLDPKIQTEFDRVAGYMREEAEQEINALRTIVDTCESPLEQKLLLYFLELHVQGIRMAGYRHAQLSINWYTRDHNNELTDCRIVIETQHPITVSNKNYRVDFLFSLRVHLTPQQDAEVAKLIVEVDGHEYHERTKEQAQHDKQRDRLLLQEGYTTFRFTGSEIYKDPGQAVEAITKFLDSRAATALKGTSVPKP